MAEPSDWSDSSADGKWRYAEVRRRYGDRSKARRGRSKCAEGRNDRRKEGKRREISHVLSIFPSCLLRFPAGPSDVKFGSYGTTLETCKSKNLNEKLTNTGNIDKKTGFNDSQPVNIGENHFFASSVYCNTVKTTVLELKTGNRNSSGLHKDAIPCIKVWDVNKIIKNIEKKYGKNNITSVRYSIAYCIKNGLKTRFLHNKKDWIKPDIKNHAELIIRHKNRIKFFPYLIISNGAKKLNYSANEIRNDCDLITSKTILIFANTDLRNSTTNGKHEKYNIHNIHKVDKLYSDILYKLENGCKDKIINGCLIDYGKM